MKVRKPLNILSRTSSITNSFVQAILPSIEPTDEEVEEALAILGMSKGEMCCAYCGARSTDWDHLRPLVRKKRPTGYINEIRNLVPSCGPCNQSKGGAEWREWMLGGAKGSPKTRGVPDIDERVARLDRFVEWGQIEPLPLRELGGANDWDTHWANLEAVVAKMREAQVHAAKLRANIQAGLREYVKPNAQITFGSEPELIVGDT